MAILTRFNLDITRRTLLRLQGYHITKDAWLTDYLVWTYGRMENLGLKRLSQSIELATLEASLQVFSKD